MPQASRTVTVSGLTVPPSHRRRGRWRASSTPRRTRSRVRRLPVHLNPRPAMPRAALVATSPKPVAHPLASPRHRRHVGEPADVRLPGEPEEVHQGHEHGAPPRPAPPPPRGRRTSNLSAPDWKSRSGGGGRGAGAVGGAGWAGVGRGRKVAPSRVLADYPGLRPTASIRAPVSRPSLRAYYPLTLTGVPWLQEAEGSLGRGRVPEHNEVELGAASKHERSSTGTVEA